MKRVIMTLLLGSIILTGCVTEESLSQEAGVVVSWHDDENNVTCWIFRSYATGALSCIPDSQLGD